MAVLTRPSIPHPCRPSSPPARADLISIKAACVEFGVSRTSLFRYVRLGRITAYRRAPDRSTLLDRRELASYFDVYMR